MPRIKIKQLEERIATAGLHFGLGPEARKLAPGEVVEIPEGELFDILWATGKIEITMEPATRPLKYKDYREAQLTAPNYKSRGPHEDVEIAKAHDAVALRMSEAAEPVEEPEPPAADTKPARAPNRRAKRRARVADGQEATA